MTHPLSSTPVLLTGITGFIGLHVARELLARGYRVRGTLRDEKRGSALRAALAPHVGEVGDRLELRRADLTADAGWEAAAAGCEYVVHVASPIPSAMPKHEDELIVPAREGTLRVLRAAEAAGTVKRVVLTSSIAAIMYGHERDGSRAYDETVWTRLEAPGLNAYEKSKTLAEQAAWEFAKTAHFELTTINPGLVLGPVLEKDYGTSLEVILKLMRREMPGIPNFGFALVDVRDVAWAHVTALETAQAAGQRYPLAGSHTSLREIATLLKTHLDGKGGKKYRIPSWSIPDFVLRFASLFDGTLGLVVPELGKRADIDASKAKRELGWVPRNTQTMVADAADAVIALGLA
jgi:nucleoside-diphosphate-sugar epimerase